MKTLTLSTFALVLVLALPVAAAAADDPPAVGEPAFLTLPTDGGQNATPAISTVAETERVELSDIGEFGSCSARADCYGGGSVSCTASSGSCWFVDNCYAVCNNQYYWCGYRPYPCPV